MLVCEQSPTANTPVPGGRCARCEPQAVPCRAGSQPGMGQESTPNGGHGPCRVAMRGRSSREPAGAGGHKETPDYTPALGCAQQLKPPSCRCSTSGNSPRNERSGNAPWKTCGRAGERSWCDRGGVECAGSQAGLPAGPWSRPLRRDCGPSCDHPRVTRDPRDRGEPKGAR